MKLIRFLFFYAAVSMLLFHNLVPHQHHGQMSSYVHEQEHQSKGVLDFWRTVFHESAVDVEQATYKIVATAAKEIKVSERPKFGGEVGQAWREMYRRWYVAALYYGELRGLQIALQVRRIWEEERPDLAEISVSIVGFRAPPVRG